MSRPLATRAELLDLAVAGKLTFGECYRLCGLGNFEAQDLFAEIEQEAAAIRKRLALEAADARSKARAYLEGVRDEARADKDYSACIKACAEIAKLDGLYAPTTKTLEHSWSKSLSNEEKSEWEKLSGLSSSRSSSADVEAKTHRKH